MQVAFDFASQRITVDGDGPELVSLFTLIRDIAPKMPSITFTATGVFPPATVQTSALGNGASPLKSITNGAPPTLREFVKSLSLGSMAEKVTAVAYYQAAHLNRPTFSPKEMGDWFTQAGIEKPNQMAVAVFDAKKRNGYVENAGHGVWRIATQGENFIIRKLQQPDEKKE